MKTILWTFLTFVSAPYLLVRVMLRRKGEIKKILIIVDGKIGDTVCVMRMLRAIKEARPGIEIHVCTRESGLEVIRNNPFVDSIHVLGPHNRADLIRRFRREKFDCSINCMPGSFISVIGLWSFVPFRINSVTDVQGVLVRLLSIFQSKNIYYGPHMNTFSHYMKLLGAAGIPPIPYGVDFFPTDEDKSNVSEWLHERGIAGKQYVVFGLSAGNKVKEWPEENFAKLADIVVSEFKMHVVLSDLDEGKTMRVRSMASCGDMLIGASGLSLGELGALCSESEAFVSADTGPMYAAYGSGAPVVVIVGPVDPAEQIPPEGPRCVHVMPPKECKPWVFVSNTPREGTEEQLICARGTSVQDVVCGLRKVIGIR